MPDLEYLSEERFCVATTSVSFQSLSQGFLLSSSLEKLKDEQNTVIIKAKYPVGALGMSFGVFLV